MERKIEINYQYDLSNYPNVESDKDYLELIELKTISNINNILLTGSKSGMLHYVDNEIDIYGWFDYTITTSSKLSDAEPFFLNLFNSLIYNDLYQTYYNSKKEWMIKIIEYPNQQVIFNNKRFEKIIRRNFKFNKEEMVLFLNIMVKKHLKMLNHIVI